MGWSPYGVCDDHIGQLEDSSAAASEVVARQRTRPTRQAPYTQKETSSIKQEETENDLIPGGVGWGGGRGGSRLKKSRRCESYSEEGKQNRQTSSQHLHLSRYQPQPQPHPSTLDWTSPYLLFRLPSFFSSTSSFHSVLVCLIHVPWASSRNPPDTTPSISSHRWVILGTCGRGLVRQVDLPPSQYLVLDSQLVSHSTYHISAFH
jgi:hypothetical protein